MNSFQQEIRKLIGLKCFYINKWEVIILMKKLEKFLLENIKTGIAFVIGVLVASGIVYAATLYSSSDLSYNNAQSGLVSTTAKGALDELYSKVNDVVPIDPDTFQTNYQNFYASSKGLCIYRNSKLNCFKTNNVEEEKNHIQEVFSDVSCNLGPSGSGGYCDASDFGYTVWPDGSMRCYDYSNYSQCDVYSDGSVNCN